MTENTLAIVRDAVSLGCRVVRSFQDDLERLPRLTKDDGSPVTAADLAVQALVALELRDRLGEIDILGEESGACLVLPENGEAVRAVLAAVKQHRPDVDAQRVVDVLDACDHDGTGGTYWTLDPVDGTRGFMAGRHCAVAVSRIAGGEVDLAVIGCPSLPTDGSRPASARDPEGALFWARRGAGAWCAPSTQPGAAPVRLRASEGVAARLCRTVEASQRVRRRLSLLADSLGGEAEIGLDGQGKYALVARGQADAWVCLPRWGRAGEWIWDHAPGSLLASEAGAVVTDVDGEPLDFRRSPRLTANRGVVCASAGLHGRLIAALAELESAMRRA